MDIWPSPQPVYPTPPPHRQTRRLLFATTTTTQLRLTTHSRLRLAQSFGRVKSTRLIRIVSMARVGLLDTALAPQRAKVLKIANDL